MDSHEIHGPGAERAVLRATRALLHVERACDVREIAVQLVGDLGGEAVEAGEDPADVVPVDLSFGTGPPLLARPTSGVAHMLLERFLPAFVEDGSRALSLARASHPSSSETGSNPSRVPPDEDRR